MPHVDLSSSVLELDVPVRIEHAGMKLVVIRTEERIFAYEDVCPHAFWPLSEGSVHQGILECPGHGWEFNVENGRCLNAPAYCLTSVSVAVNGELVTLRWENSLKHAEVSRP
jgi:nitrite reductase/ring-hydroxylating ferredoxin subunit